MMMRQKFRLGRQQFEGGQGYWVYYIRVGEMCDDDVYVMREREGWVEKEPFN